MNVIEKEVDMNELKKVELDMLKSFIDICNKLSLTYFVIGGTLLGAVRHEGFIPWDDDIDVGMLREDYDVFIREASKYLPEYYFLQTNITDTEYPYNFAKIRDSRTTFIEYSLKNRNINHGVFIDVFPLDYFPENKLQRRLLMFKHDILKRRIIADFLPNNPNQDKQKSGKAFIGECLLRIIFPNTKKAVTLKEIVIKSTGKSRYLRNFGGAWKDKEIVKATWFMNSCKLWFEDLEVLAPLDYHDYLTHIYGDYMQLPPVEKRIAHHYTDVIDLNKPYTAYKQ